MPDFTITLSFDYPIQDSVSVGDTAYFAQTSESGGFNINSNAVVEIGEITSINRSTRTITCNTSLYGNQMPSANDNSPTFILFSKNNCQQLSSLLGYFGSFKFKNTSTAAAELFSVTVDAFESSK